MLGYTNGETKEYNLADVREWWTVFIQLGNHRANQHNGEYKDGFWNYMISKKNVTQTTRAIITCLSGMSIYLYTGVTSASADESNLGFILESMRTGEITKYDSATENQPVNPAKVLFRRNPTGDLPNPHQPLMTSLSTSWAWRTMGLVKYALVDAVECKIFISSATTEELLQ